ncbi:STAS domain-containing protein [Micromonospora sp. NPDC050686]|uniref:STAS domain-containing protein n=1 Tax=Micromonospora sp. NPDC050686 TaxID=3154631 RepID=UPI0033D14A7E
MPSRIRCLVDDEGPVTVVRISGGLDTGTIRPVHGVLDRCLTEQPDALVVDLSAVRVEDPLALSVFAAAARQAASWPGVPMVLCAPSPDAAAWLAESAVCRVVPVRPDRAAAAQAAAVAAAPRLRARLDPVAGACRRARELVSDACARWNLPGAVGPASVVLTELVGNVVRHAGTPMRVTMTLRRPYLHLAVHDGSREAARCRSAGRLAEGGRGLLLVRELTRGWGSSPAADGKVVWAMLPAN